MSLRKLHWKAALELKKQERKFKITVGTRLTAEVLCVHLSLFDSAPHQLDFIEAPMQHYTI